MSSLPHIIGPKFQATVTCRWGKSPGLQPVKESEASQRDAALDQVHSESPQDMKASRCGPWTPYWTPHPQNSSVLFALLDSLMAGPASVEFCRILSTELCQVSWVEFFFRVLLSSFEFCCILSNFLEFFRVLSDVQADLDPRA